MMTESYGAIAAVLMKDDGSIDKAQLVELEKSEWV